MMLTLLMLRSPFPITCLLESGRFQRPIVSDGRCASPGLGLGVGFSDDMLAIQSRDAAGTVTE